LQHVSKPDFYTLSLVAQRIRCMLCLMLQMICALVQLCFHIRSRLAQMILHLLTPFSQGSVRTSDCRRRVAVASCGVLGRKLTWMLLAVDQPPQTHRSEKGRNRVALDGIHQIL